MKDGSGLWSRNKSEASTCSMRTSSMVSFFLVFLSSFKFSYLIPPQIFRPFADMARQNVKPNIWVFPPKMSIYATMVPNAETEYRMRGPKAATNLDADRYALPSFRGCKVVESNSFDVDFTGQPINLLERNRQIGEFFIVKKNGSGFPAILIYDAAKDGWAKITPPEENYIIKADGKGAGDATGIVYFRPHATWTMSSAILAEGGKKLGATFHGKHDMVLQTDAVRKSLHLFAFFAFYSFAYTLISFFPQVKSIWAIILSTPSRWFRGPSAMHWLKTSFAPDTSQASHRNSGKLQRKTDQMYSLPTA